jgi:hypothetical protein
MDVWTEGDDFAGGFVAGLAGQVRVPQVHPGEHGLPGEQVQIPVRAGGDGENAD